MRAYRIVLALAALAASSFEATGQPTCPKEPARETYGGIRPWLLDGAVGFETSGLAVDADGAPNSYRVDGKGLSFTCDGVVGKVNGKRVTRKSDRKNWERICRESWARAQATNDYSGVAIFGFMKDSAGRPVVQKQGDPLPGIAYISETTMPVPNTPSGTQRHWVNAVEIPYVVLPGSFVNAFRINQGDLALVYFPKTGAFAFGVYADGGDLGEASVRLHFDLGNNPIVLQDGVERAKRGISDRVVTVVFPGRSTHGTTDSVAWRRELQELGNNVLSAWGGLARVKACAE